MKALIKFWRYTTDYDRFIMLLFIVSVLLLGNLLMGCDQATSFDDGVWSGPDFDQHQLENVVWTRNKGYYITATTFVRLQSSLELRDGEWQLSIPEANLLWVGTYQLNENKIEFDMEVSCPTPGKYAFRFNTDYNQVQFLYQEDACNNRQTFIEGNWWKK